MSVQSGAYRELPWEHNRKIHAEHRDHAAEHVQNETELNSYARGGAQKQSICRLSCKVRYRAMSHGRSSRGDPLA